MSDPPTVLPSTDLMCENCGMVDEPLQDGYCEGCICRKCKKNAGDTGCSMNDMGYCNSCEESLNPSLPCGCSTHQFGCLSRPYDPTDNIA